VVIGNKNIPYLEEVMDTRSLEECKKMLEKNDRDTLERRAERCQELAQIQTDGRLFSSQREWDYSGEASASYISSNYRSATFCCARAVDQIFRYEYMKLAESNYKKIKGLTFGEVIQECRSRNVESLLPFMKQAFLLNDIRNNVATHPLFVDIPIESDPERLLRDRLLIEDMTKLLELVERIDSSLRHEIESTKLISEAEDRTYIFGEVINQQSDMPFNMEGFWSLIEDKILRFLANQCWHIMKSISEDLYEIK
jgi:hypothetical protein